MKAKDKEKLAALRGIKAVLQSTAKEKGVETLPDEECIAALRKLSKQRQESIDAYTQAGRDELAANEKNELEVIHKKHQTYRFLVSEKLNVSMCPEARGGRPTSKW